MEASENVPLKNDNDPNARVSSTMVGVSSNIVEASKNVPLENDNGPNTRVPSITPKKRGRGPKKGLELAKQLKKNGRKLDILIPNDLQKKKITKTLLKKVKFELAQAIENGVLALEAEICSKQLKATSGYIRGKGRGLAT
ncbi:hypothetical protein ACH5RR_021668 [Cinchona calisaya]|uniref:Uncharacterized protein n=1 Tax=Cinchona calisaya TaxID=153742 RepID=A0ABD2ZIY5_9GENT